jgi:tetratricopeptide (TPR) repeat protein
MRKKLKHLLVLLFVAQFLTVIIGQSNSVAVEPKLRVIPAPSLEALEPAVVNQIQEIQHRLRSRVQTEGIPQVEVMSAFGLMGKVYHAYEFFDAAEACYLNASRLGTDHYQWPHLLGIVYEKSGELEKAAQFFGQASKLEPRNIASQIRLSRVWQALNQPKKAQEILEGVLSLGLESAAALQTQGELALAEKKYEKAIGKLQQALMIRPDANRIYYPLAMAYRGLQQMEKAKQALEQSGIVGIRPHDPLLDEVENLVSGERLHMLRGHLAYRADRYHEAAEAFGLALEVAPENWGAMINLASSHEKNGTRDLAKKWFTRAVTLNPNSFNAHFNLGTILLEEERFDQSIIHLQQACSIKPDDLQAQWEWILALHGNGMGDQAIKHLYALAAKAPDQEEVALQLAIYLREKGRQEEVKYVLTQAHLNFPDRTRTAAALARYLAACPDKHLRNGALAVQLAFKVYHAQPTFTKAETVVLALIENAQMEQATKFILQIPGQIDASTSELSQLQQWVSAKSKL